MSKLTLLLHCFDAIVTPQYSNGLKLTDIRAIQSTEPKGREGDVS